MADNLFTAGPRGQVFAAGLGVSVATRNWKWFLVRGILALVFGVLALIFPFGAILAFTLVFAAYALVDGIASVIAAFRGDGTGPWWAQLLRGVVGVAIGAVFILMPILATIGYAVFALAMLAAWAIVTGIFEIVAAIRLRKEIQGEWMLLLSGILSVVLGLAIPVVLLANPLATILTVGWLIGVFVLIEGGILLLLALRLRRLQGARTGAP